MLTCRRLPVRPTVLAEVLASSARPRVPGFANTLKLPAARRVCVVMVDGLGRSLLKQRSGHAPVPARSLQDSGRTLTAAFPTTTAASLASLGTGLPPGQHGMVGYDVLDPAQDKVVNLLGNWDPGVDPRRWQPFPTVFEQAAEHIPRHHRQPAPVRRLRHDRGRPARRTASPRHRVHARVRVPPRRPWPPRRAC